MLKLPPDVSKLHAVRMKSPSTIVVKVHYFLCKVVYRFAAKYGCQLLVLIYTPTVPKLHTLLVRSLRTQN
jgi:hypothetical protein